MAVSPVRKSSRLANKKALPADSKALIPATASSSADSPDGLSAGAKRNRRYRMKLKKDLQKYKLFCLAENERLKAIRESMTPEQKVMKREKSRLYMQEWRQRRKREGLPTSTKKKLCTRKRMNEQREKDRLRQAKYRKRLSDQKKAAIKKKALPADHRAYCFPDTAFSSADFPDGLSAGAKCSRKHRMKVREDPQKYQLCRPAENERIKAVSEKLTPEEKAIKREKNCLSMQELRQRRKREGLPSTIQKQPFSRNETIKQDEEDRLLQVKCRTELSSQKIAAIDKNALPADSRALNPDTASTSADFPDGVSAGAKRNRKRRMKLKEDPQKYKLYRLAENERLRTIRKNMMPEKRAIKREKSRLTVQEWRQRRKREGLPSTIKKKPFSRIETIKQQLKDRLLQVINQKKAAIDKNALPAESRALNPDTASTSADFPDGLSAAAKRSRRHRMKLKADPQKYKQYRLAENERRKTVRKNMTPEERAIKREKKICLDKQREKDRLRQAKFRAGLSSLQKAAINEKRRERRKQKSA